MLRVSGYHPSIKKNGFRIPTRHHWFSNSLAEYIECNSGAKAVNTGFEINTLGVNLILNDMERASWSNGMLLQWLYGKQYGLTPLNYVGSRL